MQTYRNMLTDEVRKFTAEEARGRNKGIWVLVTGVPATPRETSSKSSDSK